MNHIVKYNRILRNAGFSEEQSEASLKMVTGVLDNANLATKVDLEREVVKLEKKISGVDQKIDHLELSLRSDFKALELRLLIKLTAINVTTISIASTVIVYLLK